MKQPRRQPAAEQDDIRHTRFTCNAKRSADQEIRNV